MSLIRSAVTTVRTVADRYRSELREQRQLEREIAEYRTNSDRQDLYAALSRHTAEEIARIEQILDQQTRTGSVVHNR